MYFYCCYSVFVTLIGLGSYDFPNFTFDFCIVDHSTLSEFTLFVYCVSVVYKFLFFKVVYTDSLINVTKCWVSIFFKFLSSNFCIVHHIRFSLVNVNSLLDSMVSKFYFLRILYGSSHYSNVFIFLFYLFIYEINKFVYYRSSWLICGIVVNEIF